MGLYWGISRVLSVTLRVLLGVMGRDPPPPRQMFAGYLKSPLDLLVNQRPDTSTFLDQIKISLDFHTTYHDHVSFTTEL